MKINLLIHFCRKKLFAYNFINIEYQRQAGTERSGVAGLYELIVVQQRFRGRGSGRMVMDVISVTMHDPGCQQWQGRRTVFSM